MDPTGPVEGNISLTYSLPDATKWQKTKVSAPAELPGTDPTAAAEGGIAEAANVGGAGAVPTAGVPGPAATVCVPSVDVGCAAADFLWNRFSSEVCMLAIPLVIAPVTLCTVVVVTVLTDPVTAVVAEFFASCILCCAFCEMDDKPVVGAAAVPLPTAVPGAAALAAADVGTAAAVDCVPVVFADGVAAVALGIVVDDAIDAAGNMVCGSNFHPVCFTCPPFWLVMFTFAGSIGVVDQTQRVPFSGAFPF